ncbi:MAG TPA: fibronectin type III domain-containing protein [Chitinophagales bacterium]|nr:fibronectin type III domain-containing protein [Chitinophagales bacterium]
MKKSLRIKTSDFSELNHAEFAVKFGDIVQAIGANPDIFQNVPYGIPQLNTAALDLTLKTQKAVNGSQDDRNARDIQAAACLAMLLKLAAYVLNVASDAATEEEQIALIELAKFVPAKTERTPIGELPAPFLKAEISGTAGEIHLEWGPRVRGAYSYIVQHTPGFANEQSQWEFFASTTRTRLDATGLSSGYHSFRVICVGAVGESDPSEPVTELAR